jgi:hypothetical protein
MFHLDAEIGQWRSQLARHGLRTVSILDELESHLREEVAQRMRSGLTVEQAFAAAVQQIGPAGALSTEFAKLAGSKARWRGTLKGGLGAVLAGLAILLSAPAHAKVQPSAKVVFLGLPAAALMLILAVGWRKARLFNVARDFRLFNPDAQRTMALACQEAPRLHHEYIGTEHVLLGLMKIDSGILPRVLLNLGLNREIIDRKVNQIIDRGPEAATFGLIPYTPRARRSLHLAAREARAMNHPVIGPEHIFLGLLKEGGGVAARILKNLGVDAARTRELILEEPPPHPNRD